MNNFLVCCGPCGCDSRIILDTNAIWITSIICVTIFATVFSCILLTSFCINMMSLTPLQTCSVPDLRNQSMNDGLHIQNSMAGRFCRTNNARERRKMSNTNSIRTSAIGTIFEHGQKTSKKTLVHTTTEWLMFRLYWKKKTQISNNI